MQKELAGLHFDNTLIILGTGRSGTTFLGKLFDSHPDVAYRHEPDTVHMNADIPFMPDAAEISKYRTDAAQYLAELQLVASLESVGHLPFFRKNYRGLFAEVGFRSLVLALMAWEKSSLPGFSRYRLPEMTRTEQKTRHCVIKSVSSLCRIALFSAAAPNYRFIHLIRHPCAVIASRIRGVNQKLLSENNFLKNLFRLPEAAHYPYTFEKMSASSFEEQAAFHWMISNDKVVQDTQSNKACCLTIYEQLCKEPETALQTLFRHADLAWDPQVASFIKKLKSLREKNNVSFFNIMRNPLHGSDSWKTDLSNLQIDRILSVVSHARTAAVRNIAT